MTLLVLRHYYCFHYDTVDYYHTIITILLFPLYHYYNTIILIVFIIISLMTGGPHPVYRHVQTEILKLKTGKFHLKGHQGWILI